MVACEIATRQRANLGLYALLDTSEQPTVLDSHEKSMVRPLRSLDRRLVKDFLSYLRDVERQRDNHKMWSKEAEFQPERSNAWNRKPVVIRRKPTAEGLLSLSGDMVQTHCDNLQNWTMNCEYISGCQV